MSNDITLEQALEVVERHKAAAMEENRKLRPHGWWLTTVTQKHFHTGGYSLDSRDHCSWETKHRCSFPDTVPHIGKIEAHTYDPMKVKAWMDNGVLP